MAIDIWLSNLSTLTAKSMTKGQLNIEYVKIMTKADRAIGRKEALSLLRRADRIRNQISNMLMNREA